MKVFLSWSGERSHCLASALHEWIPFVLHYADVWISRSDINAGERWADQVAKELEVSNFGILCITKENISSPWMLFEAGALAKSLQGSRVIPLLLDLEFSDITGPLTQFQAKKVHRAGMFEIIQSLNKTVENPVPDARVRHLFELLWPDIEQKILAIPQSNEQEKHARPQAEVIEELVSSVRTLDGRFREIGEQDQRTLKDVAEETLELVRTLSLNQASMNDNDPRGHWLVLYQNTINYANDVLYISENADQVAVLEQLKKLGAYLRIVANLMGPKIKKSKVGANYTAQVTEVLNRINVRVAELVVIFGDDDL